jgi:hypothetical protein
MQIHILLVPLLTVPRGRAGLGKLPSAISMCWIFLEMIRCTAKLCGVRSEKFGWGREGGGSNPRSLEQYGKTQTPNFGPRPESSKTHQKNILKASPF